MPACSLNHSLATLSVPLSHSIPSKPSVHVPLPPPPSSLSSTAIATKHNLNVAVSVPQLSSPSLSVAIRNSSNVVGSDSHSFATIAAAIIESVSLGKGAVSSAAMAEQLRVGEEDTCLSRRRRRRRRKRSTAGAMPCDDDFGEDEDFDRLLVRGRLSRSERSRCLTQKQEAEFSQYLKVGAMVEEKDSSTCPTTSNSSSRMVRRRKEKAWLRARECRERITLSYKRLVVSIAMPYQGKGLTLQDLIQVDSMFF